MPTIRVLVIDDDLPLRQILRQALQLTGYEVIEARDGFKGLCRQREAPCQMVITDIFMPDMDGFETIRELKREFPAVKIIAISGGWDVLDRAKALGADACVPKPISLSLLFGTMQSTLHAVGRTDGRHDELAALPQSAA